MIGQPATRGHLVALASEVLGSEADSVHLEMGHALLQAADVCADLTLKDFATVEAMEDPEAALDPEEECRWYANDLLEVLRKGFPAWRGYGVVRP